MSDIKFVDGLFFKKPHEKAPSFVLGKLSAKREALIAFLQAQTTEWVNMEIKESHKGKTFIALDEWQPTKKEENDF